jgi:hypothetical protein
MASPAMATGGAFGKECGHGKAPSTGGDYQIGLAHSATEFAPVRHAGDAGRQISNIVALNRS